MTTPEEWLFSVSTNRTEPLTDEIVKRFRYDCIAAGDLTAARRCEDVLRGYPDMVTMRKRMQVCEAINAKRANESNPITVVPHDGTPESLSLLADTEAYQWDY